MKNKDYRSLTPDEISAIREDSRLRQNLAHKSHLWFFLLYMSNYMEYDFAPFHKEMFRFTEDKSLALINITAFRGSAKSTIFTQSFPIWAMTGKLQKKFILIVSQTQQQAKLHLTNIKRELENNALLKSDIGPFQEITDEWNSMSIVIPKYNTRISAISTDQSMRGVRHRQYRPDLIILDDIEDLASVKTKEQRDKTYDWVMGDVIPAGNENTKIVIVGNLLHDDSVQMRLAEHIQNKEMDGVFIEYPLLDENGKPTWQSRFPEPEDIEKLKKLTADEVSWQREYMLKIIGNAGQVIKPEWIQFYNQLPEKDEENEFLGTFLGVDLAISEKQTADATSVVVIHAYGYSQEDRKYYVSPHFLNERLSFLVAKNRIVEFYNANKNQPKTLTIIEDNAYQQAMVEILIQANVETKGVRSLGSKYARLMSASMLFEQGRVLFPDDGSCKPIIIQLLGFGREKHDDLVDATTIALNYIHSKVERYLLMAFLGSNDPGVYAIDYGD